MGVLPNNPPPFHQKYIDNLKRIEEMRKKQAALDVEFREVVQSVAQTSNGMRLFAALCKLTGFMNITCEAVTVTQELDVQMTLNNAVRESVYRYLRRFLSPEMRAKIEELAEKQTEGET
jgi:GTPase Era involved in 16S rRNA processing